MPHGNVIQCHDTVGVAVVSYKRPSLHTPADVLANAHKMRQMIEGMKLGLPDLGLVIFPRHDAQGPPRDVAEVAETQVLAQACRNAQVWGVFPGSMLILMNDQGEIVHQHLDHSIGLKISLALGGDTMLDVRCQGTRTLVDFNGHLLGECGEDDYGIQYVPLKAPGPLTSANGDPRSRPANPRLDAPANRARP